MENDPKTQQELQQQMQELNDQFSAFLHTKGIKAKFRLAFQNMSASAKKQHAKDLEDLQQVKAQSAQDNKEFAEFLGTKGPKAKYRLVVENLKRGAKAAPANTAAQIARIQAQTQAAVAQAHRAGHAQTEPAPLSAATLEQEFNAFLLSKGLDGKYSVTVSEQ